MSKIFIVDDSKTALEFVHVVLTDAGHEVISFDSPLGITREIRQQHPDLVLVDVSMPALNGDKLVSLMRGLKGTEEALVLLYSAQDESVLATLSDSCHADGFVRKSDNPDDLLEAIKRHLLRRKPARDGK